jgi:3-isopropylmalate/(R)-2-methylmalate dehydratase small subunit
MSSIISKVSGGAFRLPGDDLDTDRIIPARFLKCVTFEGLGMHVFEDDRKQLKGEHPFDLPKNKGKSILVVDQNFGCGSSREHAVPALMQWGVRAIIGTSFAAIFSVNAVGNGLVCVEVEPKNHNDLLSALEEHEVDALEIDLQSMSIRVKVFGDDSDPRIPCSMPESHREMLVMGKWDSLDTALEAGDLIETTAARLPYMAPLQA